MSRWSVEQAQAWYAKQPWLVGCNFIPSSAINQLEMWQAETFDLETIEREIGWAHAIGFNAMRVFLHSLLWAHDRDGFSGRIDRFLAVLASHQIRPMFVLFDGVWDPFPKLGPQPAPRPHVHNSGWLQSPGVEVLADRLRHDEMADYVTGLIARFRTDERVLAWDLFNEPDNPNIGSYGQREPENKAQLATELLRKAYAWAREAAPVQPVTAGVWRGPWAELDELPEIDRLMLEESDVMSFHSYYPASNVRARIDELERLGRPLLLTEYMSRPTGSTFESVLPLLKERKVAAFNWGFVAGKTQTIYPWDSWRKPYSSEPDVWFHDIFRPDGAPFRADEVRLIRELTGR
jgi:hypothetical protein